MNTSVDKAVPPAAKRQKHHTDSWCAFVYMQELAAQGKLPGAHRSGGPKAERLAEDPGVFRDVFINDAPAEMRHHLTKRPTQVGSLPVQDVQAAALGSSSGKHITMQLHEVLRMRPAQDDIGRRTGTQIVTRGRYLAPGTAPASETDKPLHLHITPGASATQARTLQGTHGLLCSAPHTGCCPRCIVGFLQGVGH